MRKTSLVRSLRCFFGDRYDLSSCASVASSDATQKPALETFVGKSEIEVRQRLGQPHHEFTGHYGMPPPSFTAKFVGDVKTSVFQESDGEVYVSFEKQKGTWVVINISRLPKGAAF